MAIPFLEALAEHPLVGDGAMGTALRSRLGSSDESTSLELLNLEAPSLVRAVHASYVASGADVLQTNTYGANALQFDRMGHAGLLAEVNRRAVALARDAAREACRSVWIAGSLGPLGPIRYDYDVVRLDAIAEVYERQMTVLASAGVDLFIIETMDDYREIIGSLRAARKLHVPVVLQVACADGETVGGRIDLATIAAQAEALGASVLGANCRLAPSGMLGVAGRLLAVTALPVSIQPNAGNFHVDTFGRLHLSGTVAEYRTMVEACLDGGVRIVGGCCYTTPEHIRCAREVVDARQARSSSVHGRSQGIYVDDTSQTHPSRTNLAGARRVPSKLEQRLLSGQFVTCVEVDPPTDQECKTDPGILSQKIDGARYLERRCGVDLITIADHTMGQPWLDPFAFAEVLRPHLQTADMLLHYSCRNKAETDITGNFASYRLYGYRNILVITGDRPPDPATKTFFAYSSPTLLERIHHEHGDYFFLAASLDHTRGIERGGTLGLEAELRRLRRKVAAGAQLALTQPIFLDRMEMLREQTRDLGIPVFPGVMPIMSAGHARNLNAHFPGMCIPDWIIERQEAAGDDRRKRAQIAIEIAGETARTVRAMGFPGVYLIMSLNRFDVIKEVISEMRQ